MYAPAWLDQPSLPAAKNALSHEILNHLHHISSHRRQIHTHYCSGMEGNGGKNEHWTS